MNQTEPRRARRFRPSLATAFLEERAVLSVIIGPNGLEDFEAEAQQVEQANQVSLGVTVNAMLVLAKTTIINAVNTAQTGFDAACAAAGKATIQEKEFLANIQANAINALNNLNPNDPNFNNDSVFYQGQIQDLDVEINKVNAKITAINAFQTVTDNALQAIINGIQTITTSYMGQTMTQYQSQGLVANQGWDY